MSTASPPQATCPACGTPVEQDGTCSRCRTVDDRGEQVEAIDYVVRRLEDWYKGGRLSERQWKELSEAYARERQALAAAVQAGGPVASSVNLPPRDRCWSCKEPVAAGASHCDACGAPATGPAVKSLRFCRFLSRELDSLESGGTIPLRQAHELAGETQERIAALKRKLEKDRAPMVELVHGAAAPQGPGEPRPPRPPRRPLMEMLLDPQTIQWLFASGGGLLVIGLVIVMASLDLFTPVVVAACLGIGNALILGGGWFLTLRTRYQLAGRALTLLACLVMPLNLWYYDSKALLTLQDQLWVAALVCSAVYAASAWVLKDRVFVYVLVGGITMTGMLVLGTGYVDKLYEVLAPSALLVILGLICLHAERAFALGDGPFSRQRFGMAFFWCAHALLGAGLLLLIGAQVVGWLYGPMLQRFIADVPVVVQAEYLPWTLALALLGTYAYIYSDIVVRRIGVYIHLAAVTLLWVAVQVLMQLTFADKAAVVIAALALAGLAVNFVQVQFRAKGEFLRTVVPLGAMLSLLPVLFGVLLHFRAHILHERWPFAVSWATVGAMAVTALSCRAGAYLYRRQSPALTAFYFFATAAATLVVAAELTEMIGLESWWSQAPVVMLIPIAYLIAARLYQGHTPERPLIGCAQASTAVMLLCSLYVFVASLIPQLAELTGIPEFQNRHHLLLAVFCLQAAVFYGLSAALLKAGWNIYLTTLMLCGVIWQLLLFFGTAHEFYPLAFTLLGLVLLVAYRFGVLEKWEWAGLSRASFQSANALTMLGFVAGALLALSRWALGDTQLAAIDAAGEWNNPVRHAMQLMFFLALAGLLAGWLVQQQAWRRAYVVLAIISGALTALLFHKLYQEHPWVTLEVISILVGVVLLAVGHVGWYRETEERSGEGVSFALFLGTLAVLVPLAIATVNYRFYTEGQHLRLRGLVPGIDELGLVFACIVLLGTGIVGRLKVTTLFGSTTLTAYVLMVLIHEIHRAVPGQWVIGVYIAAGGAVLFGTATVASIYRDRLLTLPDRFKRREGLFRVFGWR
jgi:hypothetical protein